MPPLSVLIKPASSNCNLRCDYCFYHSVAENRKVKSYGVMDFDLLEEIVKKALEFADGSCSFAFQGGEPTLAGFDFFKELIKLEKKYNHKGVKINNSLQTNGIVVDEEWARFLADNNFLVGISLDGYKAMHNLYRKDTEGKGSFRKVMKTINLFNKFDVKYNILTVVTSKMARHGQKVYNYYKRQGFKWLQFIRCIDPLKEKPGTHDFSLSPARYARFLKILFDQWYYDIKKGERVSIRFFDNLIQILAGYRPEACDMNGICSNQLVIEADGSVYPCDFYVLDKWKMGNIKEMNFSQLITSNKAKEFIDISKNIHSECENCKWIYLCRGGCRRNREPVREGKPSLNYFCPAFKDFYKYAEDKLKEIVYIIASKR